jgi:hypothetical protein
MIAPDPLVFLPVRCNHFVPCAQLYHEILPVGAALSKDLRAEVRSYGSEYCPENVVIGNPRRKTGYKNRSACHGLSAVVNDKAFG